MPTRPRIFFRIATSLVFLAVAASAWAEARVFVRVKVERFEPADAPVWAAATVFESTSKRLAKFALQPGAEPVPLGLGWHDLVPWRDFKSASAFRAGDVSGWAEITAPLHAEPSAKADVPTPPDAVPPADINDVNSIAIRPPMRVLAVGFQSTSRQPTVAPACTAWDGGSADRVRAVLEFADAPDAAAIRRTLPVEVEGSVAVAIIPASQRPLTEWAERIRTAQEQSAAERAAFADLPAGPAKLRRFRLIGDWTANYFLPSLDRRAAADYADISQRIGLTDDVGLSAPGFALTPRRDAAMWTLHTEPETLGIALDDSEVAMKKARETVQKMFGEWQSVTGYKRGEPLLVKLWDEPQPVAFETLRTEPGNVQFRQWIAKRGVAPAELGAASLDGVRLLQANEAKSAGEKSVAYWSMHFRQTASLPGWVRMGQLVREVAGEKATSFTNVYSGGMGATLDAFAEAASGHFTMQMPEYGYGWAGHFRMAETMNFWPGDLYRAARRGTDVEGAFMLFPCRLREPPGMELAMMSSVMRGARTLWFHGLGPRWTGWEWSFDERRNVDTLKAMRTTADRLAAVEDTLFSGKAAQPEIAVLHGRAGDLWAAQSEYSAHGGLMLEKRCTHAALADYTSPAVERDTIRIRTDRPFTKAKTWDGEKIPLQREGDSLVLKDVPLATIQAVILE